MARHFDLVKRAQAAVDEGSFDMANDEFRLLGLQLIMKVGDISNVSRPFELADRWCDILNEEFFHQGDLEKASGIGLTSPLNDRESSNKPKSQIGFYNFICLPLYTVVAKLYPPLQVQVDQVKANLEQWKTLAALPAPA
jgi:3',5'-cyclic-nucleotide phosphodiesterase